MPYDEARWKRESFEHYMRWAAIDVPGAQETALQHAAAAEANSAGGLKGLADAVRAEILKRWPGSIRASSTTQPPSRRGTTNRRP